MHLFSHKYNEISCTLGSKTSSHASLMPETQGQQTTFKPVLL